MEKQKWWGQDSGLADLHEKMEKTDTASVKDKRVTVLGPVKQPEMDFMSHRGGEGEGGSLSLTCDNRWTPHIECRAYGGHATTLVIRRQGCP